MTVENLGVSEGRGSSMFIPNPAACVSGSAILRSKAFLKRFATGKPQASRQSMSEKLAHGGLFRRPERFRINGGSAFAIANRERRVCCAVRSNGKVPERFANRRQDYLQIVQGLQNDGRVFSRHGLRLLTELQP